MLKKGGKAYFVGIKGTGMCALAELMQNGGINVSGSDTEEVFYTDEILKELSIPYHETFDASHIVNARPELLIYSAAYSARTNPEISEAQKLGITICLYSDALGAYSAGFDSTGITGVHGKTSTTALAGSLLRGIGIPAQVLVGSAVPVFGGRSTLSLGDKYFAAECCEYRRNFLSFHPRRIILTSVEWDHQDYFKSYAEIREAFLEFGRLLPAGGELIYCADDPGASEVAISLKEEKPGLNLIPYGFSAQGEYRIESYQVSNERLVMRLASFPGELKMRVPGKHTALNAAAAIALASLHVRKEFGNNENDGWNDERREGLRRALEEFSGSKRRSEILGEAGGILFMDDYGHHPTAISSTLAGLKEFYPKRRLVLSFMSHTYTRTAALLDEFASSFDNADIVLLHKIYASAREHYEGGISGRSLFQKLRQSAGQGAGGTFAQGDRFFYVDEPDEGKELLLEILKPGDLFITMGAGSNWTLGKLLFEHYRGLEAK
jgi:UDP-N-acetylmuramate--alanine ligase